MSKDMVEEQSHEDSKWFDIWSEIEKREEADLVKSSSETKSEDVRERVMTRDLSGGKLSRQSSLRSRQSSLEQHVMAMLLDSHSTRLVQDPSYLGPHLSEPLTLESVAQLIKYFSKMDDVFEQSPFIGGVRQNTKHKVPLHRLYVLDLLKKTKDILVKLPNVVNVEFSKPSDYPAGFSGEPEVTVVGDLHGQLGDLLHIFEKQGLPSAVNQYVFNGDWVDRGHWGAEIVLILFALKVLYPNYVHLNRGNHEAREIASRDGFEKEVTIKWDYDIFECFIDVFATLPLAAIIDKKVFVVHAGLSWENFTIEDLSSCDRFAENPPAASLMEDILWSDPINKRGRYVNDRGAGCMYGPDAVADFLTTNKLRTIVRSHQVYQAGYATAFRDTLICVFSASNYCGTVGNYGAIITYVPSKMTEPRVHHYFVTSDTIMDQIKLPGVPAVAIDIVMRLVDKIIKHRVQLSQYWEDLVAKSPALNEEPGSLISKKDWAKGLEKVLRMQVPWLELLELLPGATKAVNSKGQIDHKVFLDTLNPSKYIKKAMGSVIEGLDESIEMLMGVIYQNRFDLESAFRWLDQAGTGVITIADFMLGIKSLASMNLLTVEEAEAPFMENEVIDALAKLIDSDEDGLIAYEQFFESLQGLVLEDVVKHNASKLGK